LGLLIGCDKDPTTARSCPPIAPKAGVYPCKGKLTHPTLGNLSYQNIPRYYQTVAPNTLQYRHTYLNAAGNLDSTALDVRVVFSTADSSVTVSPATTAVTMGFDMEAANPNWYDSCTGTLYLKFSWLNRTRTVVDTCFFQ
jgi:hypothetical protein